MKVSQSFKNTLIKKLRKLRKEVRVLEQIIDQINESEKQEVQR